jgi:hypothetical protein
MATLFAWIDHDWLLLGLSVVAGLVLLPYVLGPVLIYFTLRISGKPVLEEFSLDHPDLPRDVKGYLSQKLQQVREDGFEPLGAYYLGALVSNVRSFLVLAGNRSAHDLALVAVTYTETARGVELQQQHIEYSTRFRDGTIIDTNNSEELSAWTPPPEQHVLSLPWIQDVRYLYRVHQAAVGHWCPGGIKEWRPGEDPGAYLREALVEEVARQVPKGYVYRDAAGDFRPTVKGAVLMTWKNLWPVPAIRKARRRRRGERLLRELAV